ncbi:MAG TPA: alpha/beta hydrolase [Beijerinckiaceae bacterium]
MHPFETHDLIRHDGARIVLRRAPNPGRTRLVLSHGNGFAIGGYRAFWSLLQADFELVLHDLRNHGANPLHTLEGHTVAAMADDHVAACAEIAAAFGPRPTIGVFHSISSIAAILAAGQGAGRGVTWDALALIDPPLTAPEGHEMRATAGKLDQSLAQYARTRPHHFARVEDLAEQYAARLGRSWVAGAAMDMATAVTRPAADGGVELACPGAYEARIYEDNARTDSFSALGRVGRPAFLIGADPDMERAMSPARIGPVAAATHGLRHTPLRGCGHMLQIEKPQEAVAALRAEIERLGLARG